MNCPKCGYQNEDGALFCEQCKEDLDAPISTVAIPPAPVGMPPLPLATAPLEDIPVLELVEPIVSTYQESAPVVLHEVVTAPVPLATPPIEDAPAVPASLETEIIPAETPISPPPVLDPTAVLTPSAHRKPKLIVIRGLKMDVVYPLYDGMNYIGRTDDQPVDIDLDDQESPERIWCSRQHAIIHMDNDKLTVEDLKSLNGTFVNRTRVHPGQMRELAENDVLQIGTVHMKVVFS